MTAHVKEQIRHIPSAPGVYIYRDADGSVLYVGKAKDLRKRVRQYFTGGQQHRTALFVPLIDTVQTIVAGSEKDALLLENTLIKRYRPPFNVDLKDDKSYPCFRVTVQEEYPRLEITRKLVRDGSVYFGPFTDARAARATLNWLEKAFPLRRCRGAAAGGRGRAGRPCLDFQMGRCLGPCAGEISRERYGQIVQELLDFLKGNGKKVVGTLEKRMKEASRERRYEEAALLRDRIRAVETVLQKQDMVGNPGEDVDILGFAVSGSTGVLTCLFVRSGMLVGKADTLFRATEGTSPFMEAFLTRHYREGVLPPPVILCPSGIDFTQAHEEILSELAGRKVRIRIPSRGRGRRLAALASENAVQSLKEHTRREGEARGLTADLAKVLGMRTPPSRIECVDISHTSGRETYGSTVVWEKGSLVKDQYRLYTIRSGEGQPDDYAALSEILHRRFQGSSSTVLPRPDLFLIDGGKGQLSRAVRTLGDLGVEGVSLAAISKARAARRSGAEGVNDEIYLPDRLNPLRMPAHSPALHLLQRLRDEAHRFALASHRRRRSKDDLLSRLDGIEGVGPVRRKALLTHFRSVQEIQASPVEELAGIRGFNMSLARRIKEKLK